MAKRRRAKTVLVIEDEADVRKFVSRVLELEGYHVLEAGDADEGLRLARENQPALVLLDLGLPGRDGWSVLEEMKIEPEISPIPVLVFSAYADAHSRDRAFSLGAIDFLTKPLAAANLREGVAGTLRHKR